MTAITLQNNASPLLTRVVFTITIWFLVSLGLAITGAFDASIAGLPATLILGIVIPIFVFGITYRISEGVREFIGNLDIRPLILLHTWRMLGLGFVFLSYHNVISPVFAFPAGLGDTAAAIGALFLGVGLYAGKTVSVRAVKLWNTFGLLDFVVAVTLGLLARPEMGVFSQTVTSAPMGLFPLVLIPGFVVPFYIITHWIIALNVQNQLGNQK